MIGLGAPVVTEDPVAELGALPGLGLRSASFLVWLADEADGAWVEAPAWLLLDGHGGPYLLVRRRAGSTPSYEACWAPDGPVMALDADQFQRAVRRNTHPADASPSMTALDELHARADSTTWVAWGPAALVADPSRLR